MGPVNVTLQLASISSTQGIVFVIFFVVNISSLHFSLLFDFLCVYCCCGKKTGPIADPECSFSFHKPPMCLPSL